MNVVPAKHLIPQKIMTLAMMVAVVIISEILMLGGENRGDQVNAQGTDTRETTWAKLKPFCRPN